MAQTISHLIFNKVFLPGTDPAFDEIDLTGTHYEPYKDKILACIKFLRGLKWKTLKLESFDGAKLIAYYYDKGSDKTAVLCHGYRSHYLSNSACPGKYFADRGYNLLIIVSRGHDKSGGDYITFGEFEYKDLLLWLKKIKNEFGNKKIVLYGVSLGSNTVMRASEFIQNDNIKVLVLDCGFTNTRKTLLNQVKLRTKPWWLWYGLAVPFISLVRKNGIKYGNFDINNGDTRTSIAKNSIPAFFIHGMKDQVVPIEATLENFKAQKADKELFIAPNAQHGAGFAAGGKELEGRLDTFLNKYM